MNNFTRGLLFGLGFAIGILIIAASSLWILKHYHFYGESPDTIVGTNAISINDYRIDFIDDKPCVLGTIKNNTKKNLKSVIIEASIFNKDNCFFDKDEEYIDTLPPGEPFGYKISFYDWKKDKPTNNLQCKVRIKQGFDRE